MRISDWSSDVCSSDLDRRRSRPRASAMAGRSRALGRRAQHRRVRRPARPGLRSCPDPPPSPEWLSRVLNLAEYRHRSDRLADHLPLAALVAPGAILTKDGGSLLVLRFRRPDLEHATEAEPVSVSGPPGTASP